MAPGSSSSKVSRKRASSDQLREQANRNVRPAKGKLMNKNRLESSGSSVQRPSSPPLPGPATDNLDDDSGDNSEYEQLELEPTDVDDENMDWGEEEKADDYRRMGNHGKGQKGFQRDARMMAVVSSKTPKITVVSRYY